MKRLWLIGGTQESRFIVAQILTHAATDAVPSLLISVTTEAARQLYPQHPSITVWVGKLLPKQADSFISDHHVGAILDASHPFARAISQLAIALAQRHQLPYLRYERPQVGNDQTESPRLDAARRPGNIILPNLEALLAGPYLAQERTLLTLGYRMLAGFASWQSQAHLCVRILPSQTALAAALDAGFTPDRIVALRPPISAALEKSLWQQWQITQVVTKASGRAGGEDQKQAIAAELGIRLIRLARPVVIYPRQTSQLDEAVEFANRESFSRVGRRFF